MDDLYGFTTPWFKKLYSPYWSKIEAYEIRRVALLIIGNSITGYAHRTFPFPAHTDCGSDCSVFVNAAPPPVETVDKKDPKGTLFDKREQMEEAVKILDFETAAILRDEIRILENFKKKKTA